MLQLPFVTRQQLCLEAVDVRRDKLERLRDGLNAGHGLAVAQQAGEHREEASEDVRPEAGDVEGFDVPLGLLPLVVAGRGVVAVAVAAAVGVGVGGGEHLAEGGEGGGLAGAGGGLLVLGGVALREELRQPADRFQPPLERRARARVCMAAAGGKAAGE